jgi:Domain of unknown function (DUF4352)
MNYPQQPGPPRGAYGQQHYPTQQQWPPPQPVAPRNGFGITALALSLIGLLFCLMPITGFIGLGLGLLGFLFAALGLGRVRRGVATNKGMSIAGLILSVLAIVLGFVSMKMFFDIVSGIGGSSSPPSAVSTAGAGPDTEAPAATPAIGEFTAGQTADREGLQITAGPLTKVKPQFGNALLCSQVSYVNASNEEQNYNPFDWKLQDPNNNIVNATYSGEKDLNSGSLAAGGKVAGSVCFEDPKLKGDYWIINEQLISLSSSKARWKATA